jgi:hypothetical protein
MYRISIRKPDTGLVAQVLLARCIAVDLAVAGGIDAEQSQRILDTQIVSKVIGDVDTIVEPTWPILPYYHVFGGIFVVW